MLTSFDRVQVVVADAASASVRFHRLLGAERVRTDRVRALAARRVVLRAGTSEIELLQPDGAGPAAEFLAQSGGGLYAAGFATPDLGALRSRLRERAIAFVEEGGQLLLSLPVGRGSGLRAVIGAEEPRPAAGLLRHLYEVTSLVSDHRVAADDTAALFGLDAAHFVPIRSEEFGYEGVLTLFRPERLDRIEIVTPHDAAKTMGRFFAKRGPSLYMCYGEADDLAAVRERLLEYASADWTGPRDVPVPDNLFIHPKALGGVMIGVSRTTFGWTWSGHPEWVQPAS